jgi:hypothetical protein
MKLLDFQQYYNGHRTHAGLDGRTPEPVISMAAALSRILSDANSGMKLCRGERQASE